MVRAVNQHACDTGRSHLADRYFLGALQRGWPLDELDETEAARRASKGKEGRAPGRPNCPRGLRAYRHSAVMTIPMDGQRVESQSRDCAPLNPFQSPDTRMPRLPGRASQTMFRQRRC